ncbi:phosphatidate cytidylyltransferase [bacterium]|nr:phosphatidate cytidylyltransferase [candidate division CSSED10-310 bacterium]
MKNMLLRYMTALIAVPILIIVIQFCPSIVFDTIAAVAIILALYEWCHLSTPTLSPIYAISLAIIALTGMYLFSQVGDGSIIYVAFMTCIAGASAFQIFNRGKKMSDAAQSIVFLVTGIVCIVWGGGAVIMLRETPLHGQFDNREMIYFLLATVWVGDAGALHVGKTFGKTPLAPIISPKKTVEGLIGAICFGVLAGYAADLILDIGLLHWQRIFLPVALVLMAHAGDLTISIFKRAASVKDSGSLLPGHGGFLDRLDNLFYSAPFLYCFARIFWHA